MSTQAVFQIFLYLGVLVALVRPLGEYVPRVYQGERTCCSVQFGF